MTSRTRYFVVVSLLVLAIGLGTGLVAYFTGFPTNALTRAGGPDELQFVPRNATLVAYASVTDVMSSRLRERLRLILPSEPNGRRDFENETGINIETDIDRIVACIAPRMDGSSSLPGTGLVLARGRFNEVKIEALMREHGATVEDYKGVRLIVAEPHTRSDASADSAAGAAPNRRGDDFSVAFIESGLAAIGSTPLVRNAVDLKSGGDNVTANEELMNLVQSLEGGNLWAVGRFDALSGQARLPGEITSRLPAITWFSASGHVNGGVSGVLRAEVRDDASAENLRDVIRGFLALAKMQAGSRPEILAMVESLQLGGTGKSVALSFEVPEAVFDLLGAAATNRRPQ
jgi:hypothetical protein